MKLLHEMAINNVPPDSHVYTTYIDGLYKNGFVLEAMKVFSAIGNHKCVLTIETCNCLIDGLCKIGRLKIAWDIFHMLMQNPGLTPDVVTYNIMIHGFCKEGQHQKANGLLLDMEETGLEPNVVIFDTIHLCVVSSGMMNPQ